MPLVVNYLTMYKNIGKAASTQTLSATQTGHNDTKK
jgi:hypothetical protein